MDMIAEGTMATVERLAVVTAIIISPPDRQIAAEWAAWVLIQDNVEVAALRESNQPYPGPCIDRLHRARKGDGLAIQRPGTA